MSATVSWLSDEREWAAAINEAMKADTVAGFATRLRDWLTFFPDAAAAIAEMLVDDSYAEFRRGLALERRGKFAGEKWAKRFGAILMPEMALRASMLADEMHAPWGAALIRLTEVSAAAIHRPETPE